MLKSNFLGQKRKWLSPARMMLLGYLLVILTGTMLLLLPVSHKADTNVDFLTALFTATSATSVTGLVVVNTAHTWSMFGHIVMLCLIQIGALGFMSFVTVFFFIMSRKIGLSQRLLIIQSLNLRDIQGVIQLVRHVLIGTLLFQLIGAILLWIFFLPKYGLWQSLGMGVFHSVTAFANAGFDLFTNGLSENAESGFVTSVIMMLAFIGGLGFFVWEDIWQNKFRFRRLHLHSKLVLSISFWLILAGWILFFAIERNNPATIGNMELPKALHISLFQVIMPRSTGFSMVLQEHLSGAAIMIIMILMLIGGSAGSTAGGIKNVTAGILVLSAINYFRGRTRLEVFRRTIPTSQIKSALAISMMVIFAAITGSMTISIIQPDLPFSAVLFETISAIATCGLSQGITSSLAPASQIILILFMFFGRVGIITLGMVAFLGRDKVEKTKHPDTWVMMG